MFAYPLLYSYLQPLFGQWNQVSIQITLNTRSGASCSLLLLSGKYTSYNFHDKMRPIVVSRAGRDEGSQGNWRLARPLCTSYCYRFSCYRASLTEERRKNFRRWRNASLAHVRFVILTVLFSNLCNFIRRGRA